MKDLEFYLNNPRCSVPDNIVQEIISRTLNCSGILRERMYWLRNDLIDYPTCQYCDTKLTSRNFITNGQAGYRSHCSVKCGKLNQDYTGSIKKRIVTNVERYGSNSPWAFKNFRKYMKERFNVDAVEPEK